MYMIFFDLETTGVKSWEHEIIQIAAVAMEISSDGQWRQADTFECKLTFDMNKADPEALEMNCYDEQVWAENATSPREALESFDYWSQMYKDVRRTGKKSGKVFFNLRTAGHNIDSFDIPFLRALYKAHDKFCSLDFQESYDTLKLSKWLFALWYPDYPLENNKLETLCNAYGVPLDDAHDALADIQANAKLAWCMRYCKPKQQEED